MARTVLSVALLACLGFAVLQLVSGEQEKQELEATSNEAVQAKPEDVEFRVLRESDAKKKRKKQGRKGGKRKNKKAGKGKGRKGKKGVRKGGKGHGKKASKGKGRKTGRKGGQQKNKKGGKKGKKGSNQKIKKKGKGADIKTRQDRQACNNAITQKASKLFRRYSNNLRQLKRLNKTCQIMDNKRGKVAEFNKSGEAPGTKGSHVAAIVLLSNELRNCTGLVKTNCITSTIPECTNTSRINVCSQLLEAWLNVYSLDSTDSNPPATKNSCLNGPEADFCTCIENALPANPPEECLDFKALDGKLKPFKKKCLSDASGSFGACRKLQLDASYDCGSATTAAPSATTAGSSGRRKLIRNNLMKKWINN